jgi:hypothetical protein
MMMFGKKKKNKNEIFLNFFSLRIFKLQAQIICNEMQMSNDEVQEYQVEYFLFLKIIKLNCFLFCRNF